MSSRSNIPVQSSEQASFILDLELEQLRRLHALSNDPGKGKIELNDTPNSL